MTKLRIATAVTRSAARHPRTTLSMSALAARHWRGIATTTKVIRSSSSSVKDVSARASDPVVRGELQASAAAFAAAMARARQLGFEKAAADKKLNRELEHALGHASKAATRFRRKRQTHRLRWLLLGSLVAAAAYGESIRRSGG
jgi:hypothetical protein